MKRLIIISCLFVFSFLTMLAAAQDFAGFWNIAKNRVAKYVYFDHHKTLYCACEHPPSITTPGDVIYCAPTLFISETFAIFFWPTHRRSEKWRQRVIYGHHFRGNKSLAQSVFGEFSALTLFHLCLNLKVQMVDTVSARTVKFKISIPAFFVAAMLSGCGENNGSRLPVSETEFGDSWPLTVDSGYLECWKKHAVLFHSNGRTYAVNGTARGWRHSEGWRDIEEIWADDPRPGYFGKDISPILDRGLSLC